LKRAVKKKLVPGECIPGGKKRTKLKKKKEDMFKA